LKSSGAQRFFYHPVLSSTCTGHQAKNPLFLSDFNKTLIFFTDFQEILVYHIPYKNPSSGSQAVPCGWTDVTETMNLTVAFNDFVNTPKKLCTITKDM
jgi:hypothetical protein